MTARKGGGPRARVWPSIHNAEDIADASEFAAIIEDHLLFGTLSRAEHREAATAALRKFREKHGLLKPRPAKGKGWRGGR